MPNDNQATEARRQFLLAALRSAHNRCALDLSELDEIGLALKYKMISPEFAVSWLDYAGLLKFLNVAPYENKIEVAA